MSTPQAAPAVPHEPRRPLPQLAWFDVLWLLFLFGLALLPPVHENHKQMILGAFGALQLLESRLVRRWPRWAPAGIVLAKIGLSALLIQHTSLATSEGVVEPAINSRYYEIFFLPVITAALYFGAFATLAWSALASAAYLAFLVPVAGAYTITRESVTELALRVLFFFIAAVVVNRIVLELRRQRDLYRLTASTLEQTNARLREVQEQARRTERLAALGQLSAGLAHEIRNPLSVIKGSAEMLIQNLPPSAPLPAELAGYIASEVNRVNALVSRFLDFARPLRLQTEPCRLEPILDRAIDAVQARLPAARVAVTRAYAPGLPQLALDETLAESVFENLVSNAFEALGEAGGSVHVAAVSGHDNGTQGVVVTVSDTGPGVPPEMREQIFNPFVTTKKTGVGLGLSIVAKIVDHHGGSLRLESPHGAGATFRVFLPAGRPEPPGKHPA